MTGTDQHPLWQPDGARVCQMCAESLAGCASGLFCVGCGQRHVAKQRWGYADLEPSTYYVVCPSSLPW